MSRKVANRSPAILDKGGALKCNFCQRRFTFKKWLKKHEHLHRTDPRKNFKKNATPAHLRVSIDDYQCDKCSSSFKLYAAMERHVEAHLLADTQLLELQDEQTDLGMGFKTNEIGDGVLMRCVRCELVYTTQGMYQHHMHQYHSKALACEKCGKKFTLPNSLNTHRLNNRTSFPKDCDDCSQFCATKKEYMGHMNTAHGRGGPENRVTCEIGGKLVKNKNNLERHLQLVHAHNGAYFPCDKCGKVLKSKDSLEYHSKVHTGEYKFRCDQCGHGYIRFGPMEDCKNTHAGIFKFNCPDCEYKTNKIKALTNHITTHSSSKPWICPICQHTSSTTSNLNNHIKKVHKLTLCKAEALTNRSRYGREMTEGEIEQNFFWVQRAASTLETKELYSDSQQQAVNIKILESRENMKNIRRELLGGRV